MTTARASRLVPLLVGAALIGGCDLGPKQIQQTGFRGTAMEQVIDPDNVRAAVAIPPAPYDLPEDGGPTAAESYENVQVLGGISAERFNHLMSSISLWVTGDAANCAYCHNPENMASDTYPDGRPIYTKLVARRMIQMTWNVNDRWSDHVKATGVTCWTCHRGQPVPQYVWANEPAGDPIKVRGQKHGQNTPDPDVGYSSLPYSAFAPYFAGDPSVIRVAGSSAYPSPASSASIKTAEASYGLMMHTSQALGVNCTYCHNSQSFKSWTLSNAQRTTAWYGIRMVRDINDGYITPLAPIFPAVRKGPLGDPYKVNCLTCHQGQAKPLGGQSMLAAYPYMHRGPLRTAALVAPADGAAGRITARIPAEVRTLVPDLTRTAEQCNADFAALLDGAEVHFDTGSAAIQPRSRPLLDQVAAVAGRCSGYQLTIEGHTDTVGTQAANLPLSRDRAVSVANYLVGRGVQPGQMAALGFGAARLREPTPPETPSEINRRIEMRVAQMVRPGAVEAALARPGEMTDQSAATTGAPPEVPLADTPPPVQVTR